MLRIDFETRSGVDLIRAGAHIYASDPSTSVLMMAYAFDDEPVELWLPGENFPKRIMAHVRKGGRIAAFNAQFERLIWWYVLSPDFGVPEPKLEQFYCTAAQARANNLPGNLGNCARALGADHRKMEAGKDLIRVFCLPQADGSFIEPEDRPTEWETFKRYCIRDVEAERDVGEYMRPLTDSELRDYWISERINDVGLRTDRPLAEAAIRYADEEQRNCLEAIAEATSNEITKARGKRITTWVYDGLPEDLRTHMHVYRKGEKKITFDKNARERLMSFGNEIDPNVLKVIEYADFAQASSTGKFAAMVIGADPEDDRVRGCYILGGASGTGRYAARRLQPHNMPRDTTANAEKVRELMLAGAEPERIKALSGANIMQTLKGLLRYSIVAEPRKTFVCGDWSQIEGRVCPWLAHGINRRVDAAVDAKLALYADPDVDVYCETASGILGRPIEKSDPERQGYGKVPELALQFGGGEGAFLAMAAGYGVNLPKDEVQKIVKRWRSNNPWAQPLWYALFNAAVDACRSPGVAHTAGRCSYLFQPEFLGGTLWCLLPSGRLLCYPETRCEWKLNKFGEYAWQLSSMKASWKPKADETEWPRFGMWPGLLAENVTQAVAADILRQTLVLLVEEMDAPVVGHTHDEVLLEVVKREAKKWARLLEEIMVEGFEWTVGLPLAAEIWTGVRYRK